MIRGAAGDATLCGVAPGMGGVVRGLKGAGGEEGCRDVTYRLEVDRSGLSVRKSWLAGDS